MTNNHASFAHLSNDDLIAEVHRCAADERQATARLIASLAEFDARRLYLGAGCSSLFTFCTQVLRLSEHAAYHRIEAARAGRRFPVLLDLLAEGALTLKAIGLLAPHLTAENHRAVLDAARHKSKRDVEHLVAKLPAPAVPAAVRKLPAAKPAERRTWERPSTLAGVGEQTMDVLAGEPRVVLPQSNRPAVVKPLAPEVYELQCTLTRETYDKLRRAQDLLRHAVPNGDPAAVLDRALRLLVASLEKQRLAVTDRPRAPRETAKRSRHIPAHVKRAVWARDGSRCAFVGTHGRCLRPAFSRSITSCRTRQVDAPPSTTFRSAVEPTTRMRRSSISGRVGRRSCGNHGPSFILELGPDRAGGQWADVLARRCRRQTSCLEVDSTSPFGVMVSRR